MFSKLKLISDCINIICLQPKLPCDSEEVRRYFSNLKGFRWQKFGFKKIMLSAMKKELVLDEQSTPNDQSRLRSGLNIWNNWESQRKSKPLMT